MVNFIFFIFSGILDVGQVYCLQNISCVLKEYGGALTNGFLSCKFFFLILDYPNCDKSCSTFETSNLDLLYRFNDNTTYAMVEEK